MALLAISTSGTVSEAQEAGGLGAINEGPSTMEQGVNSPPPTERLINDESKKWKRITCSRNRKLFFAVLCAGFVGVAIGAGIFIYVKLYEPLVRVTFHNLCSSDISVRGYKRIGDADCNPTSHAGNCPILRPGQSLSSVFAGFALNGKAFFYDLGFCCYQCSQQLLWADLLHWYRVLQSKSRRLESGLAVFLLLSYFFHFQTRWTNKI